MNLHDWWILFWQQIIDTDALQWLAVILGITEVLLAKSNKIWLYPAGIGSTVLTVYILFRVGLYAECLLNGYYIVMSIYGWWYWIKKKDRPPVKISYCNRHDWIVVLLIVVISFALLSVLLKYYTPSTVPIWDAWVSATAWAGMWLLSKRKIENWILLNISNLFAIPLLVYKQVPLFAALTLFLFIVAVFGYFEWRKIILREKLFAI
jgi:nicotinamide mononucleotide transporter